MFFDEADALFGSRSEVRDSRDRYANQEVAYLLQRMEQFDGVTILATNLSGNLDKAFSRRMSFIVHFPDPDAATRRRLWQSHLDQLQALDPTIRSTSTFCAESWSWPAATSATSCCRRPMRRSARTSRSACGTSVTVSREYRKLGKRVPEFGFPRR